MSKAQKLNSIIKENFKICNSYTISGIANYYTTLGEGISHQYANNPAELNKIAKNITETLNTDFNECKRPSYYLTRLFNGIQYGCSILGIELQYSLDY